LLADQRTDAMGLGLDGIKRVKAGDLHLQLEPAVY
jgi:hypothetical protein